MAPPVAVSTMWDEVEEQERGQFPVHPAGVYTAYLADWEKRTPKPKLDKKTGQMVQNPDYYSLDFILTAESGDNFHQWGIGSVTPRAIGFFKKDLKTLGATWPTGLTLEEFIEEHLEDCLDDIKGNDCRVKVRVTSFDDVDDDGNTVSREKNEIRAILTAA